MFIDNYVTVLHWNPSYVWEVNVYSFHVGKDTTCSSLKKLIIWEIIWETAQLYENGYFIAITLLSANRRGCQHQRRLDVGVCIVTLLCWDKGE